MKNRFLKKCGMAIGIAALSLSTFAYSAQEITLGWNTNTEGTPRGAAAKAFNNYIESHSDNQLSVNLYPNETFGTQEEMIDAIQLGALDAQIVGSVMMDAIVPAYSVLSLPFLLKDQAEAYAIFDSEIGKKLAAMGDDHNLKVIGNVDMGFSQITNNVRPIYTLSDMKGLQMRAPTNKSDIETLRSLGSSVSTMAYTELYTGLSQGVIDGQFNPLANIYEQNMHEVQDYLAMVNLTYLYSYLVMSKGSFDTLDEEMQQVVLDAGVAGTKAARTFTTQNQDKAVKLAEERFKEITRPDTAPFAEAVRPVYDIMAERMGQDIIDEVQAFLKKYRQSGV
jgi:C4-dicarboxylate-binding protein DctP